MFWKKSKRKKTSGQALVEFALMMAFFLIFLLALIDLGRAWFVMVAVQNAAGEGSLYGMANPNCVNAGDCPDPDNIEYRIKNESSDRLIDSTNMQFTVTCLDAGGGPDCIPGAMLTVEVTYDFEPLLPALSAFGADVITIRRESIQLIP
jgi:hypothetical protein